jgi:predicted lipid-binding transport protein (Tim44 family)
MKGFVIALIALALGAGLMPEDAQAKGRLGSGRSVGTQRQATTPQKQTTPPSQQAAPAAPQPQPAGASRWLGPLAGLAAGLGLGWLFANGGFGGMMGTLLLALLAGFVVMMLLRLFVRPRVGPQAAQYAGLGADTAAAPPLPQLPLADAGAQPNDRSPFAPGIPAGFDVEGFLKEAKRNFVRLQEANDHGDLERLREVTTGEMFDALKGDIVARTEPQQTDVVTLSAALLEVTSEGGMHRASVRFSGSIREEAREAPAPLDETWHLQKPMDGSAGWRLAGIQQLA